MAVVEVELDERTAAAAEPALHGGAQSRRVLTWVRRFRRPSGGLAVTARPARVGLTRPAGALPVPVPVV